MLCRETLDFVELMSELREAPVGAGPRVVFWPSYIGESNAAAAAECEAYRTQARELAVALGAWVLQSNWPGGLNQPDAQGFGGSIVLSPDGTRMQTLPRDAPALALVQLG